MHRWGETGGQWRRRFFTSGVNRNAAAIAVIQRDIKFLLVMPPVIWC